MSAAMTAGPSLHHCPGHLRSTTSNMQLANNAAIQRYVVSTVSFITVAVGVGWYTLRHHTTFRSSGSDSHFQLWLTCAVPAESSLR